MRFFRSIYLFEKQQYCWLDVHSNAALPCLQNEFLTNPFLAPSSEFIFLSKQDNYKFVPSFMGKRIFAFAENYYKNSFKKQKKFPLFFEKGTQSLISENEPVSIHRFIKEGAKIWGESELAVIVSETHEVFAVTLVNDITMEHPCHEGHDHHLPFFKGQVGFCPCSSYLFPPEVLNQYKVQAYHDGELLREGTSEQQIYPISELLPWLATWIKLTPGDMILLGAPPRVTERKFLQIGSKFKVVLNNTFSLENTFI
ncbi:MAG: fumarylacetoacetate hydrolase family protein [Silvanigrellaceae bacterium]|nr:fumarylacetoacetate hydrolase family protein [Silvanigrellaceae bacterium]